MTVLGVKTEVNLNTIAIIASFLGTFAGLVVMWTTMVNNQADFQEWIGEHDKAHETIAAHLSNTDRAVEAGREQILDLTFRSGVTDKALLSVDQRLTRMTDSYNDRFSDIQVTLQSIMTQQALANQALQRIEAIGATHPQKMSIPNDTLPTSRNRP